MYDSTVDSAYNNIDGSITTLHGEMITYIAHLSTALLFILLATMAQPQRPSHNGLDTGVINRCDRLRPTSSSTSSYMIASE